MSLLAVPGVAGESEIRVGFTLDALTLDPANYRKRETETIIRNMYDGLLTRTHRMEVVPELAESWKQIDPLTYEFKLRRGVRFHSGEEMTADDVKFTFERLTREGAMEGRTSPRRSLLPSMKSVEAVDKYTVRINLTEAWPHLPSMLPLQEVVSRKFVTETSPRELDTTVNGTGPFKLVEWRKGEAIVMQRFDGYYGGARDIPPVGAACVERVVFRIIPDNQARVDALLAGEVDIINELPASEIGRVRASGNARVMKTIGTRTFFVALNNTRPPFDDPKVRRAANHALDKRWIIQSSLAGNAVPVNGVLSPDAFGFNRNLPAYKYDPEKARRLLAEAGYPGGIDVAIDVEPAFRPLTAAIADMLHAVGIRATVREAPIAGLKAKWRTAKEKTGDMWFTSWGNSSLDPVGIFVPTLRTGGRGNASGYSNAEVDRLLDAAETEIDRGKRAKLYMDAQAIINADVPWIFLWVPEDLYGVSTRLKGWRPSPDSRINLHDACVE